MGEAIASFPNLFPACNQRSLLSQIVVETTGMKRGELIYLYSILTGVKRGELINLYSIPPE